MARNRKSEEAVGLVVPHTHWDRAWYWPFERFRVRLVELFQGVKRELALHPEYRFTFDGQTVMVEDYLEVHPEDEDLLMQAGHRGCIKMGPLYVLPDLYCTGGEALIRNALTGMEMAERFAAVQTTLHLPDTFGITPSIPMIAAGFEMPAVTFMRGSEGAIPPGLRMFKWHCPDRSVVRTMRLRDGYANAARLGRDPEDKGFHPRYSMKHAVKQLRDALEKQNDGQGPPFLLLAGVDHQIPQPELTNTMQAAARRGRMKFICSDLNEVAAVMAQRDAADWLEYQGEFHGKGAASVLGGTVSARIYLKQDNAETERLLVNVAEPAHAMSVLLGRDDPAGAVLKTAWKHLLKTHPHDNICGCSIDPVHADDVYHMRQASDSADAVRRLMMGHVMEQLGTVREDDARYAFALLNTQAVERCGRVRVVCDFEGRIRFGDDSPPEAYAVVDDQGHEIPFRETRRGRSTEHPHAVIELELAPALKPMTVQRFYLEPRETMPITQHPAHIIENDRIRVEANSNGSFDLTDKATGNVYSQLGLLSDQADVGDTYDFRELAGDTELVLDNQPFHISRTGGCSGLQALKLTGKVRVPATSDDGGRSSRMVALPFEMVLSIGPDSRHVECRLRFENTACDHRLRMNIPLPWKPRKSRAGLKFNEVERPVRRATRPSDGKPTILPEHPGDHFVSVDRAGNGLAVFAEFPFNYEVVPGSPTRLAIALVRSVRMLSRTHAGPNTPTPAALCLRSFDFRFAVRPYNRRERNDLFFESALWRSPSASVLAVEPRIKPVPLRDKSFQGPFIEARSGHVLISAFKVCQSGRGVVLRVFNPYPKEQPIDLNVTGVYAMQPVGLHERPLKEPALEREPGGAFRVTLPPFGLQSYLIRDSEPWACKE